MNANRQPSARIFQVNFAAWSPPVMAIADSIEDALQLALHHRDGDRGAGPVMTWDATDAWLTTNANMRVHSEELLDSEVRGVVAYDPDEGWLTDRE